MFITLNPRRSENAILFAYCSPFLEEEKMVLQEVEEEMNKYIPKEGAVGLSLNRGLASTSGNNEMS